MSLTLRDAQHLCWKNFRKINDALDVEGGKEWTPSAMVTDLTENVSEIASTVKSEGSGISGKQEAKDKLGTELSNLLYMAFVLAEQYGIELEESFLQTVNDYVLKFIK